MEIFINEKVEMLKSEFSKEQIKEEVWHYCLRMNNTMLRLDAIIYLSMEIYAEIIKRYEKNS